jgi:hypothetical protein
MAEILTHPGFRQSGRGMTVVLGAILAILAVLLAYGIAHRTPVHAVILITSEDCRRVFDDGGCRAIVARAQAIHADTAPNFRDRQTCEFAFGTGSCSALKSGIIELPLFAPSMIAIAVTPDRRDVLPLYFGASGGRDAVTLRGRAVYYHGRLIGSLVRATLGGADTSLLADRSGEPLTANFIRQLSER